MLIFSANFLKLLTSFPKTLKHLKIKLIKTNKNLHYSDLQFQ